MSKARTSSRLKVQHPHAGKRGWEIAFEPGLEQVCQNITEANARRLVACWNACEGIDTEDLEAASVSIINKLHDDASKRVLAQRDALLEALIELRGWQTTAPRKVIDSVDAAIAKVKEPHHDPR